VSLLDCSIVTPQKKVFEGKITYINAPGKMGEFGVLPGHENFITVLDVGIINIKTEDEVEKEMLLVGGYFEVTENKIIIIADEVYFKEDIDKQNAQKKSDEYKNKLSDLNFDDPEYANVKRKFDKYNSMLKLAS
jgi:F-type H+-transporting ATPase subunit epsilon